MARSKSTAPPTMGPYLPPSMTGGSLPNTPQQGFPSPIGKSRSMQMLGNYTGRAIAGLSNLTGPDQQFRHAFSHYGKAKESKL